MKTIRTKYSQVCIWSSDHGTHNSAGTVGHAVVLGIPHAAPCEGLGVATVFLNLDDAKTLADELAALIVRIEVMKAKEPA